MVSAQMIPVTDSMTQTAIQAGTTQQVNQLGIVGNAITTAITTNMDANNAAYEVLSQQLSNVNIGVQRQRSKEQATNSFHPSVAVIDPSNCAQVVTYAVPTVMNRVQGNAERGYANTAAQTLSERLQTPMTSLQANAYAERVLAASGDQGVIRMDYLAESSQDRLALTQSEDAALGAAMEMVVFPAAIENASVDNTSEGQAERVLAASRTALTMSYLNKERAANRDVVALTEDQSLAISYIGVSDQTDQYPTGFTPRQYEHFMNTHRLQSEGWLTNVNAGDEIFLARQQTLMDAQMIRNDDAILEKLSDQNELLALILAALYEQNRDLLPGS